MTTTNKVIIPGLEKGAFERLATPKTRLNWSVFGDTKTGKTSLAMSGIERPVVLFDLDKRLERVKAVEQADEAGKLAVFNIKFPKVDPMSRQMDKQVQKDANSEWDRFLKHYDMALESSMQTGGAGRVVIDTATELFDLRLMAEFGRLMGIQPRERGGANAEFTEVMRRVEHYDANVIWLHHAKDEWKNITDANGKEKSITTGNVVLDGFNKANRIAQVVVRTSYNDTVKDPRKRFEVTVLRCGVNSQLNGSKFTSLDWCVWDDDDIEEPMIEYGPVAYISSLAVPTTDPGEWQ